MSCPDEDLAHTLSQYFGVDFDGGFGDLQRETAADVAYERAADDAASAAPAAVGDSCCVRFGKYAGQSGVVVAACAMTCRLRIGGVETGSLKRSNLKVASRSNVSAGHCCEPPGPQGAPAHGGTAAAAPEPSASYGGEGGRGGAEAAEPHAPEKDAVGAAQPAASGTRRRRRRRGGANRTNSGGRKRFGDQALAAAVAAAGVPGRIARITRTTTGAVVTDGPPPTHAAPVEGTAHEHDIPFHIRGVVLDVRMQPAPSGDVSCRTPMTPELSDHGPVGLEGAPAVRQATNLTISSRAPTTDNP
jgi:hypothetical protein